jgi:hypothetical protein
MPLLTGLFQIIKRVIPATGGLSEKESKLLVALNPEKFYVENVRSILGISHTSALRICETAVRQGLFKRGVEVRCPDGAVAATADSEELLPREVRCWNNVDGFLEAEIVSSATLEKVSFYRLNEFTESAPYTKTA